MHVAFRTMFSGSACTLLVSLHEYTTTLAPSYQDMLTAAVVRRVRQSVATPHPLRLSRVTAGRSDFDLELNTGGLSNGERMDAIQAFQDLLKAFIEPAADEILESLSFILQAVAIHEGGSSMTHRDVYDGQNRIKATQGAIYDDVAELKRQLRKEGSLWSAIDGLQVRLLWMEATLRTLPLFGHRFAVVKPPPRMGAEDNDA